MGGETCKTKRTGCETDESGPDTILIRGDNNKSAPTRDKSRRHLWAKSLCEISKLAQQAHKSPESCRGDTLGLLAMVEHSLLSHSRVSQDYATRQPLLA